MYYYNNPTQWNPTTNSDGSCYFNTHNNVLVYASNGMKCACLQRALAVRS